MTYPISIMVRLPARIALHIQMRFRLVNSRKLWVQVEGTRAIIFEPDRPVETIKTGVLSAMSPFQFRRTMLKVNRGGWAQRLCISTIWRKREES